MKTSMVPFAEFVNSQQQSEPHNTQGVWVMKLFQKWRTATERMKAYKRSSLHTQPSQALLVIPKQGSVVQQLLRVGMQEREKNRAAMKSVVCSTHFLTWHHISHFTTFNESCGARELQVTLKMPQGMQYTLLFLWFSGFFFEALEAWGEESYFKKVSKGHQFLVPWQISAMISRQ